MRDCSAELSSELTAVLFDRLIEELEERIAVDPADPAPYLILADCLQAEGDPRGELITIQHALASRPGDYELIRAESRLVHAHPGHFLPESVLDGQSASWQWRLGFLRRVTVHGDQAALDLLLDHHSAKFLEELRCEEWLATDRLAETLSTRAPRSSLKTFFLDCQYPFELPRAFLDKSSGLESLHLGGAPALLDGIKHSKLLRLSLHTSYQPHDLTPLLSREQTPSLTELVVHGGQATALEALIDSDLLAGLRRLTLKSCGIRDDDARLITANPEQFRHLEHLGLDGNCLDQTEPALRELGQWVEIGYQHFDI